MLVNELVSNAVKHGAGDIGVTLKVSGESARLEVWDNGEGFDTEFDPLRSANTGLQLIDNVSRLDLQGRVLYRNRPERGALVVVEFPRPVSGQLTVDDVEGYRAAVIGTGTAYADVPVLQKSAR